MQRLNHILGINLVHKKWPNCFQSGRKLSADKGSTFSVFNCSLSSGCRIGEGNGNRLQYSCLENPRVRGAWWAAVYGVAESRTRLKRLSSSSSMGFPCGLVGKESTCSAGDLGLILGLGKYLGGGDGNSLEYPCLENFMGRGAWWAIPHGVTKSQTQLSH